MTKIIENSPSFIQVLCGYKPNHNEDYVQISKESYKFSNSEEGFQWSISVIQEQVPNQMRVIAFSIIENYLINHLENIQDEQRLLLLQLVYDALSSNTNQLTCKLQAYIIYTLETDFYSFFDTFPKLTNLNQSLAFLEEFLLLLQNITPRSADIIHELNETEAFQNIMNFLYGNFTPSTNSFYFVLKQIIGIYEFADLNEAWNLALHGLCESDTKVEALELMALISKITKNYNFVNNFILSGYFANILENDNDNEQVMYNLAVILHYQMKKSKFSSEEIIKYARYILLEGQPMAAAVIVDQVPLDMSDSFSDIVKLIFKYNCDEDYVNQEYVEYLLSKFVICAEYPVFEAYLSTLYEIYFSYADEENQMAVALTFTEIVERIHRNYPDSELYGHFIEIFIEYFEIEPENSLPIQNSIFMNLVLIVDRSNTEVDLDFVFHQLLKRIDAGQEEFIAVLYRFIDKSLDFISFDLDLIENLLNSGNYQLQKCVGLLLNYVNDPQILYAIIEYIIQLDQSGILLMVTILGIRRENFSDDLINTLMTYLKSRIQEFKEDDAAISKFISVLFHISEENALNSIKELDLLQYGPESLSKIIEIFKEKKIQNSDFFRIVFESFTDVFHNATMLVVVQEFKSFIEDFLILLEIFNFNIDTIPYEVRSEFFKFAIEAFQYSRYLPNSLQNFTDFFMNYYSYLDHDQLNEIIFHSWDVVKFIHISVNDLVFLVRFHSFCVDHNYCGNDIFVGFPEIAENEEIKNEYFGLISFDPKVNPELFSNFLDKLYESIQ